MDYVRQALNQWSAGRRSMGIRIGRAAVKSSRSIAAQSKNQRLATLRILEMYGGTDSRIDLGKLGKTRSAPEYSPLARFHGQNSGGSVGYPSGDALKGLS